MLYSHVMTVIDIIIIVLLALAVFKGIKDGLVRQVGGIAGLILGIFLAGRFSAFLAGWMHQWIDASESAVKAVSFAVIIIVVCLCMYLLGRLLEKIIKITTLGWINRLLGVVLSICTVVLLIGAVISLIEYINSTWFVLVPQEQLAKSKSIQIISSVTDAVFPYLKQLFNS